MTHLSKLQVDQPARRRARTEALALPFVLFVVGCNVNIVNNYYSSTNILEIQDFPATGHGDLIISFEPLTAINGGDVRLSPRQSNDIQVPDAKLEFQRAQQDAANANPPQVAKGVFRARRNASSNSDSGSYRVHEEAPAYQPAQRTISLRRLDHLLSRVAGPVSDPGATPYILGRGSQWTTPYVSGAVRYRLRTDQAGKITSAEVTEDGVSWVQLERPTSGKTAVYPEAGLLVAEPEGGRYGSFPYPRQIWISAIPGSGVTLAIFLAYKDHAGAASYLNREVPEEFYFTLLRDGSRTRAFCQRDGRYVLFSTPSHLDLHKRITGASADFGELRPEQLGPLCLEPAGVWEPLSAFYFRVDRNGAATGAYCHNRSYVLFSTARHFELHRRLHPSAPDAGELQGDLLSRLEIKQADAGVWEPVCSFYFVLKDGTWGAARADRTYVLFPAPAHLEIHRRIGRVEDVAHGIDRSLLDELKIQFEGTWDPGSFYFTTSHEGSPTVGHREKGSGTFVLFSTHENLALHKKDRPGDPSVGHLDPDSLAELGLRSGGVWEPSK